MVPKAESGARPCRIQARRRFALRGMTSLQPWDYVVHPEAKIAKDHSMRSCPHLGTRSHGALSAMLSRNT